MERQVIVKNPDGESKSRVVGLAAFSSLIIFMVSCGGAVDSKGVVDVSQSTADTASYFQRVFVLACQDTFKKGLYGIIPEPGQDGMCSDAEAQASGLSPEVAITVNDPKDPDSIKG